MSEAIIPLHFLDGDITWNLGHVVGKGAYSTVYSVMANRGPLSGEEKAGKVITKHKKNGVLINVAKEISIHSSLQHPNIVAFVTHLETPDYALLITEMCLPSTLWEVIKAGGKFSRRKLAYYLREIGRGLQYLHKQLILHRDLKPANIFLVYNPYAINGDDTLKPLLGDFGLATRFRHSQDKKFKSAGSPNFVSNCILSGNGYSFPADMWSLGVIAYICMTGGNAPFETDSVQNTLQKIQSLDYPTSRLSTKQQFFISHFFTEDARLRITADELLKHPFLERDGKGNIVDVVLDSLSCQAEKKGTCFPAFAVNIGRYVTSWRLCSGNALFYRAIDKTSGLVFQDETCFFTNESDSQVWRYKSKGIIADVTLAPQAKWLVFQEALSSNPRSTESNPMTASKLNTTVDFRPVDSQEPPIQWTMTSKSFLLIRQRTTLQVETPDASYLFLGDGKSCLANDMWTPIQELMADPKHAENMRILEGALKRRSPLL